MQFPIRRIVFSAITAAIFSATTANASVILSFTNGTGTPTSTSVSAGSPFSVVLQLTSTDALTTDAVTSVDYYLQASASNVFSIAGRNTSSAEGTPFGFTLSSDTYVASTPAGPKLNSSTGSGYDNSTDLGASLTDGYPVDPAVSGETVPVATYSLSVASGATPGIYTVSAYYPVAGFGYSDTNNAEHSFASLGTYTVTVTPAPSPEPATAGLLAVFGIAGLLRRNRLRV